MMMSNLLQVMTLISTKKKRDNYGLSILRLPTKSKAVLSEASFLSYEKTIKPNKNHTYVLGSFYYSRSDVENVNDLKFYIQKHNSSNIKIQNDSVLYLTFVLDKKMAIDFNSSKEIDIWSGMRTGSQIQFNELMILNKDGYLYFIYLRHYNKVTVQQNLLEKIISFQ